MNETQYEKSIKVPGSVLNPHPTGTVLAYMKAIVPAQMKHGFGICSVERFLVRYGMQFRTGRTAEDEGLELGRAGLCFSNSMKHALKRGDLIYCEGICSGVIPQQHGWLCKPDGTVIEMTDSWDTQLDYFGIPFRQEFVRDRVLRLGVHSILAEARTFHDL